MKRTQPKLPSRGPNKSAVRLDRSLKKDRVAQPPSAVLEINLLRSMAVLARRVVHFNQIAAREIDEGATALESHCHDAEQALLKAVVESEQILGITPEKDFPVLLDPRRRRIA